MRTNITYIFSVDLVKFSEKNFSFPLILFSHSLPVFAIFYGSGKPKKCGSVESGSATLYFFFKSRAVPDTGLAEYPAAEYPSNNFAGYRISG